MNENIELHDSDLAAVSTRDGEIVVTLAPAYIHRSAGLPGIEGGSGWLQPAALSFGEAVLVDLPAKLPATISEGVLRIGGAVHSNLIPGAGEFRDPIELALVLTTGETLTIEAHRLRIDLHGVASFVENYDA